MKLFHKAKDGGPESNVTGYWLIEWKRVFSIALLRFSNGTRDSFHSHAFNSISWLLRGKLEEQHLHEKMSILPRSQFHSPGLVPIVTRRNTFHRVKSWGTSWVLTFRGPWSKTWREFDPAQGVHKVLESGRKVVKQSGCRSGRCRR